MKSVEKLLSRRQLDNSERIFKFGGVFTCKIHDGKSGKLLDIIESKNLVVNTGGALGLDLIIGAGGTAFNNANAYIGIGDSNTAPAVGQTDLQAATNKLRKAMQATFPSRASQVVTFESIFGTSDANWSWEEIGLFNASTAGTMFSRALVSSPFTKTSAISVTVDYTLTLP